MTLLIEDYALVGNNVTAAYAATFPMKLTRRALLNVRSLAYIELPSVALDKRKLAALAVLKSPFIDVQSFDPVLKSRGRHPKLDRRSRCSGNPTSALG